MEDFKKETFVIESLSIRGNAKPRENETKIPASRWEEKLPLFVSFSIISSSPQNRESRLNQTFSKIAKKIIMNRFLATHFDLETPEYHPEDFQGAAPEDGVIYISSDETMECMSIASVDDLDSLSDDDEVALVPLCVERQMKLPTTTENNPVPTCAGKQETNRAGTPTLSYIPGPMFDAGYFDLGMARGPVARDSRLRNDHPINICSQLIPIGDRIMSPPAVYNYPSGDWRAVAETTTNTNQVGPSTIHFRCPSADNKQIITG